MVSEPLIVSLAQVDGRVFVQACLFSIAVWPTVSVFVFAPVLQCAACGTFIASPQHLPCPDQ